MKHSIVFAFASVFLFSSAHAQFGKGTTEIGLNAGFGSMAESSSNSAYSGSSNSSTTTYGVVAFTPAYYVTDGLSIEPELGFTLIAPEKGSSSNSYSAVGNLSYTFYSPGGTLAPFFRAGYGVSNGVAIPVFTGPLDMGDDLSVNIINAGAGLKFLAAPHVCLRTELNYKRQFYSKGQTDYSNGTIGLQLGVSLLLWNEPKGSK